MKKKNPTTKKPAKTNNNEKPNQTKNPAKPHFQQGQFLTAHCATDSTAVLV